MMLWLPYPPLLLIWFFFAALANLKSAFAPIGSPFMVSLTPLAIFTDFLTSLFTFLKVSSEVSAVHTKLSCFVKLFSHSFPLTTVNKTTQGVLCFPSFLF